MPAEPRNLSGKVAAVTGGARGIGLATARAMLAKGMKVAIGDVDVAGAEKAAQELGDRAVGLELNVTDRESFERFVDAVEERLGPLDVLVNNAGIMPLSLVVDEDDATAQRQVDINIHGVVFGTKIALKRFLPRGTGHLVNIASMAGKGGFPGGATYCGTKHFVIGFTEAARAECLDAGVEVSCVMPGVVNTELTSGLGSARLVKTVQPEEVAAAIVEALERPHFDVFVPKSGGRVNKVLSVLPRRGREAVARALKADRVLVEIDANARRAYELRAARSEPGLEPAPEQPQLTEKAET